MTTPHEKFEECRSHFVSYSWFSWVLVCLLASIITVSVAAAVNITEAKTVSKENKAKIEKLEGKVDKKLDRIIELIREGVYGVSVPMP